MEKAGQNLDLIARYFDEFTSTQWDQFAALPGIYEEWNSKINVISRKDLDSLYEKHVLHSLAIAALFTFSPGTEILDLGTGGGFPGIPLAIFFPDVKFHLVDSIGKKIKVVQAVADTLKLSNVTVAHTRAEDIRNRKFDYVVSRAVAPLGQLWKWSRPLLKKAGHIPQEEGSFDSGPGLICLKGGDLALEIQQSNCKPMVADLFQVFPEPHFQDKFLLYVSL